MEKDKRTTKTTRVPKTTAEERAMQSVQTQKQLERYRGTAPKESPQNNAASRDRLIKKVNVNSKEQRIKYTALRKRRKARRRVLIAFLILILFLVSIYLMRGFFNIKEIKVMGNEKIAAQNIINSSGVIVGDNLFSIGKKRVEKALQTNFPTLDEVKVEKKMPTTLAITVKEGKIAAKTSLNGEKIYVSETGKVMEKKTDGEFISVPYIVNSEWVGVEVGEYIYKENPADLDLFISLLDNLRDNGLIDKINYITYKDKYDIRLIYENRLEIKLGNQKELTEKLKRLNQIIPQINPGYGGTVTLTNTDEVPFTPKNELFPWWEGTTQTPIDMTAKE